MKSETKLKHIFKSSYFVTYIYPIMPYPFWVIKTMGTILLIKRRNIEGYLKAEEISINDLWDKMIPNPLADYGIPMIR